MSIVDARIDGDIYNRILAANAKQPPVDAPPQADEDSAAEFGLRNKFLQLAGVDDVSQIQAGAQAALDNKLQIGVSTTLLPVTYFPVELTIRYTKIDNHSDTDIISTMLSILEAKYSYNSMGIKETIYPEDIETWIRLVPGLKTANVTELYRRNDTPGRRPLVGGNGEVFRITPANIDIGGSGTDSTPTGMTINGSALTPTFAAGTLSYTFSTSGTTATIRILNVPAATIAYNDTVQEITSSGTTIVADLTLASGLNSAVIDCIAEDGVTTTTYTIGITKT
jgi:hypothetical protein